MAIYCIFKDNIKASVQIFMDQEKIWLESLYKNRKLLGNRNVYYENRNLKRSETHKNDFKLSKSIH